MTDSTRRRHTIRLRLAAAFVLLLALAATGLAQCAMCKAAAENMDPVSVRNLNFATLLLLTPPVGIFCAFFYAAYKRRDAPGDGDS
jgi:hypothetical protein